MCDSGRRWGGGGAKCDQNNVKQFKQAYKSEEDCTKKKGKVSLNGSMSRNSSNIFLN